MMQCLLVLQAGQYKEIFPRMTTDSFIQALTRLTARRGNVRQIHSNNEPNFVGVDQELINAFNEMDHTKIQEVLQNNSADWIK